MPLCPEAAETPRRIFSPIADGYDTPALVLSLFQYRRWHQFLLSRVPRTGGTQRVLDLATGTGALALDLLERPGTRVVGADITRPMLEQALARAKAAGKPLDVVECTGEALPFADESFDAIVFAYLLRYVSDVPGTLRGLARLLRPGGVMASLDFGVPRGGWYPLWRLYTDAALPLAGRAFSADWRRVGSFLGPSIRGFYLEWPERTLRQEWREAGFEGVRSRRLSLGGGIVTWGTRA
jgi:demethylmenaquinone methyltransferase / 2-methoxy-6-polyprenyl-1,4-benzoquinol methylase